MHLANNSGIVLAMSTTGRKLMDFYEAMVTKFGNQKWWPGDSPLEVCIGAILTQNTNWQNVEKAIANLKALGVMSISALLEIPHEQLAELIRPSGYFNVKAKRLRNFLTAMHESHGDDIEEFLSRSVATLREELLGINGIGRETADSIILDAAHKPTFVVDAYTYRILLRHHIINEEDDYQAIKQDLQRELAGVLAEIERLSSGPSDSEPIAAPRSL